MNSFLKKRQSNLMVNLKFIVLKTIKDKKKFEIVLEVILKKIIV